MIFIIVAATEKINTSYWGRGPDMLQGEENRTKLPRKTRRLKIRELSKKCTKRTHGQPVQYSTTSWVKGAWQDSQSDIPQENSP